MKNYIGTKAIKAKPMNLGDYNNHKGWTIPDDEDPKAEGYLVEYKDGYQSWSPKKQFEEAYHTIKNTVTIEDVVEAQVEATIKTIELVGKKHTVVAVRLKNGFTIVETTTCVDPANYSEEIGSEICFAKIEEKIWMLLGFELQTKLSLK